MATKESNMRSFVLRIDGETMEALEKWAADEFRSTNGQLQWIIAEALRRSGRKPRAKSKTKGEASNDE
ncbi:MAG: DNA-binding protein [Alistipes sp.]|nr:DNA-binding protein [Alistipes sp.]MEE0863627.1 DNA-binding protein [Alistipes sp.]